MEKSPTKKNVVGEIIEETEFKYNVNDIPESVFDDLARYFLPEIRTYYENKNEKLKDKIFYYYLTLGHNKESGLELAKLIKLGLVSDSYPKMLMKSTELGSLEAKKYLIEYYKSPKYYNENILKRYI